MTRPDYDVQTLTIEGAVEGSGFEGLWDAHNTDKYGDPVQQPDFFDVEAPGPGESSRSLPTNKRTRPLIYVHDESPRNIEYADPMQEAQDYDFSVRMEVVVADAMDDRTGKAMRDAVIHVLENIREANNAPQGGVFGSDWQELGLVNIDTTPTKFSNQWRAYYDIEYSSFAVV